LTPPSELEKTQKAKEINQTKDFNLKRKLDNSSNNLSKSSKSPYNKDKFLKHIKAASKNLSNFSKEAINKSQNDLFNNTNNNKININKNNNSNNNLIAENNLNSKSLSIISENSTIKRKIFQNNFLAQPKGEKNYKENYKSENEFINNINNINRTKTPNTRSINRDFSENIVYSNKIKPKNNLNYTNRESTLHILSDRDRKPISGNSGNTIIPNQLSHNNTITNLSNLSKNNNNNKLNNNANLDKKITGCFNYALKTPSVYQSPYGNNSNSNSSTKNNNNNTSGGGVYQFKVNPLYHNSIINKSLNGNINNNVSLNANNSNFNYLNNNNKINNVKDLLGNNMDLSLNLKSEKNNLLIKIQSYF